MRNVGGRRRWWIVMESDISSDFHRASPVVGVGYPDEISLGIFCISEEAPGFTAGLEFCEVICDYTCCAFCTKRSEVGEVGTSFEPEVEGRDPLREGGMRDALFDVGGSEHGEGPEKVTEVGVN
jgi:hypothetical protein